MDYYLVFINLNFSQHRLDRIQTEAQSGKED